LRYFMMWWEAKRRKRRRNMVWSVTTTSEHTPWHHLHQQGRRQRVSQHAIIRHFHVKKRAYVENPSSNSPSKLDCHSSCTSLASDDGLHIYFLKVVPCPLFSTDLWVTCFEEFCPIFWNTSLSSYCIISYTVDCGMQEWVRVTSLTVRSHTSP
jgi:hypothetical protein